MSGRELPLGWCWATPDQLAAPEPNALAIGPFGSNLTVKDYTRSGTPLIFVRDIRAGDFGGRTTKFITNQKADSLSSHMVRPGDLLITKMGDPPGDVAVYPLTQPVGVITADCIKISPDRRLTTPQFLALAIRAPQSRNTLLEQVRGVAQQKLSLERFRNIPLPLPPLAEQQRIVSKLEALLSRSRGAKEALDAIPVLLERFRRSVLAAAFQGDLTKGWRSQFLGNKSSSDLLEQIRTERRRRWEDAEHERLRLKGKPPSSDSWKEKYNEPTLSTNPDAPKAEWFGDLDSLGWNAAPLELLADPVRGIPYGIVQTGDPHPTGVPTVRCGDLKNFSIEPGLLKRVDPEIASQFSRTRLEGGEVLVAIRGTVGGVAVASPAMAGMNISREVAMVPSLPGVLSRFLMYLLASPVAVGILAGHTKGVAQSGVNLDDLRSFPVPLPSTAEQNEIVKCIEQAFARISAVHERWKQATEQIDLLNDSMLSRAFRGELVPQDPNDEPASVLLERIRAEREAAAAAPKQRRTTKATGRKSATENPT